MREEVYRVAFDEASAELSGILARFEQLRLRKDQIEKVVEALKPLVAAVDSQVSAPVAIPEQAASSTEKTVVAEIGTGSIPAIAGQAAPPTPIPYPASKAKAVEDVSDPFARRVEDVMGLGSASRDVREYSRLFNTSTSRG